MDRPDTSIQTYLQRTFQFVVAVMLVTSCCLQVRAQEAFVANTYTVIGDVLHPNTYPWPSGRRVPIQMALRQAGFDGPSGTAVVRTARQPDRIIPGSAYLNASNPIFLNPGDTVIWRSVKGSRLKSGNVAILTDQGPWLQAIPIKGVSLGTLLESARLRFDQPVVAHRNSWGKEHSFLMQSNTEFVKHGDVLDVRAAMTRGMETQIAGIQHAEITQQEVRPSAVNTVASTQPEPQSQVGVVRPVSHPLQTQAPLGGLRVPPVPEFPQTADTSPLAIPAALPNANNTLQIPNTPFETTHNIDSSEDSTDSNLAFFQSVEISSQTSTFEPAEATTDPTQLAAEASHPNMSDQKPATQSFLSGVFLFGLMLAIGLITVGIVRTRQEQRLALESRPLTTTQQTTTQQTPNAASMLAAKQQKPAAFTDAPEPHDQALFSVASTATSEPAKHLIADELEVDIELENCPVLSVGLKEPNEITVERTKESIPALTTVTDFDQQSQAKPDQLFESSRNELLSSQPTSTHVSAYSAVDLTAWLSNDLPNNGIEDTQQAVAAERLASTTSADALETNSHSADVTSEQPPVEEVSNRTQTLQLRNAKASSSQEFNSDDPILELPDVDAMKTALAISEQTAKPTDLSAKHESVVTEEIALADQTDLADTSIEADVIDSPQTIQDQEDIMAHPPMTQAEAQYLEDLIQNRLPMELSETQLPLRINLFGKPEGPRRLRIDAAHSTIAPPHMASAAARAKRREPAMAMKRDATESSSEQATRSQAASPTNVSANSQTTTDGSATASQLQNSEATTSAMPSQSQNPTSGLDKALNFLEEQSKS